MITGIGVVTVWVLDQDSALRYYTEQLGFEATADVVIGDNGMRWLTVRPPGGAQELLLVDLMRSMLDAETGAKVRALVEQGAISPGVLSTTDCRADHAELSGRGATFSQGPEERHYGIEAILRDDSGNWYSFTQRAG